MPITNLPFAPAARAGEGRGREAFEERGVDHSDRRGLLRAQAQPLLDRAKLKSFDPLRAAQPLHAMAQRIGARLARRDDGEEVGVDASPQGGVDLAEMKKIAGEQVCLIGNVNCALLQTGSDAEVESDVRRALRDGMPGGGYVFGTSNCIYTGMELRRYEQMLSIWRAEGLYAPPP